MNPTLDADTVARVRVAASEIICDTVEVALARHDAPTTSHLLSEREYRLMRCALTELANLALALEQPLTPGSFRALVASAVRRGLGGSV